MVGVDFEDEILSCGEHCGQNFFSSLGDCPKTNNDTIDIALKISSPRLDVRVCRYFRVP